MKDQIHKAERRAVPGLIALAGPSSSGKTFSALLLAAGICPKGKRIGFIDTEIGRGEHYADDEEIIASLPEGYDVLQLDEPHSPDRYYKAISSFAEKGNYGVVIVDSVSHEWEGFGGCQDIAESNKLGGAPNWAMAKKEHKRFMRKGLTSPFTVIFCIRAQEKTEVVKVGGKTTFRDLGMQPVQEKNFKFEMLIACMLDPYTKFPMIESSFHKVPRALNGLFQPGRYITKQDGILLGKWIAGGKEIDTGLRSLQSDFKTASNNGLAALKEFWGKLTPAQQKTLESIKEECKEIASEADRQASETAADNEPVEKKKLEEPLIKPTDDKNEKAPTPSPKPAVAAVKDKAANPPVGNTSNPVPKAETPKLAVVATPKQEVAAAPEKEPDLLPEEDLIPQSEPDEANQNAQEIAAALMAEEDEFIPEEEELELL